jgi:hypothetical protein
MRRCVVRCDAVLMRDAVRAMRAVRCVRCRVRYVLMRCVRACVVRDTDTILRYVHDAMQCVTMRILCDAVRDQYVRCVRCDAMRAMPMLMHGDAIRDTMRAVRCDAIRC